MRGSPAWGLAVVAAVVATAVVTGSASADRATASPSLPTYNFVPHAIPTAPYDQVERANKAADINGDGRPDLVIAGEKYLVWYENPPDPTAPGAVWTAHKIANGIFGIASLVAARDLNGDGRVDLVLGQTIPGATVPRQMAWFENKVSGWVRHTLSDDQSCHHLDFGDLNGDGRVDIACAGGSSEHVLWLQQPADLQAAKRWNDFVFDTRPTWGAKIADIDRDGKPDIVAGRAWYRNPGLTPTSTNTTKKNWRRYPYTLRQDTATRTGWQPAYFNDFEELNVLDLNGDGRLDVVASLFGSSPESAVSAFLAPANPLTGSWAEVPLDAGPLFSVHTQQVADFDGSGRVQVAVGEMAWGGYGFGHNPGAAEIFVYRLEGPAGDPASWKRYEIASDDIGTHAADAIDVDGDGRFDLITGEENSGNGNPIQNGRPRWWENETAPVAPTNVELPTISGFFREGEQVSASDGTWEGANGLSRQWLSCDVDGNGCQSIPGATLNTLTVPNGQAGHRLVFQVTATNDAGSTTQGSEPSPIVDEAFAAPPMNVGAPTLSATAFRVGGVVTGSDGSWNDATSLSRQWMSCDGTGDNCEPIVGQTGSSLTLTAAEYARTIRFAITAGNSAGTTTQSSEPSPTIAPLPNRAPDPSFETAPKMYYTGIGTGTFQISNTVSHTGSRSWQIDGSGTGLKHVLSKYKYVDAQAGAPYEAAAWFKTGTIGPESVVCLQLVFYNKAGSVISRSARSPSLTGTSDWTQISLAATSPAKTAFIAVDAILDNGPGTVWYDDLYLTGPVGSPNTVKNFLAMPGDAMVTLTWSKPALTLDSVDIVRKIGSDPVDESDGTLVYSGKGTSFVDTGVTNGIEYHYAAWGNRAGTLSAPSRATAVPVAPIPVTYTAQPTGAYDAVGASWTVGAVFHVTTASTLTRLGKVFTPGSTAANTVGLWDEATQALLFSATISPGAPAVDVPPLLLQANKRYVLGIKEASGSPWSKARLLTGLPSFLIVDDGAFLNSSTFGYPTGRDSAPGTSNEDWTITLTPGGSATHLDPVTGLAAAPADGRVDLSWTNPASAFDSINVVRKLGSDPADLGDGVLVCACTGTSVADVGLTNGSDYHYAAWVVQGKAQSVPARANATPAVPTPVTYTAQPTGSYAATAAAWTVGAVFHVTVDKTVTELGKAFAPGSTATDKIGLWDEATQTLLFSDNISPASPTVSVSPQLVLQAGKRYVLGIKEATGSPWSKARLLTGLPPFLVIDDSAFVNSSSFAYPGGRDSQPGFSNEDWIISFAP